MKLKSFLLFISIISLSKCISNCGDETVPANSYKDCQNLNLPFGTDFCCYEEVKNKNIDYTFKVCDPLTKESYNDLDSYVSLLKGNLGPDYDIFLDCGSKQSGSRDDTKSDECFLENANSYNDCKNRKLPDGKKYCCYFYSKFFFSDNAPIEQSICNAITETEYNNLESIVEETSKTLGPNDEIFVDCGSKKGGNKEGKTTDVIDGTCDETPGKSFKECEKLDKPAGKQYCCYIHFNYQLKEQNWCYSISQDEYNNFDQFIKDFKEFMPPVEDFLFDCGTKHSGDDDDKSDHKDDDDKSDHKDDDYKTDHKDDDYKSDHKDDDYKTDHGNKSDKKEEKNDNVWKNALKELKCNYGSVTDKSSCNSYSVNNAHCCYFYVKGIDLNEKYCIKLENDEYNKIDKYINELKSLIKECGHNNIFRFSIDCFSNHLNISKYAYLVLLFLLILL